MRRFTVLASFVLLVVAGPLAGLWAAGAAASGAPNTRVAGSLDATREAAAGVCRNQYSGPQCAAPSTAPCSPAITSMSSMTPGAGSQLTLGGSCFGTGGTFTDADSSYLRLSIFPKGTTVAQMSAVMGGRAPVGLAWWNACSNRSDRIGGPNTVTCTVSQWTNTRLTLHTLNGGYGDSESAWYVYKGSAVAVQVWNVQTGAGPAIAYLYAGAPGSVFGSGVTNGHLSTIASSLVSPLKAFRSVKSDAIDGVIALGLFQFILFPAEFFNSTFEENYADIAAWWEKWTGLLFPAPLRRAVRRTWTGSKTLMLKVLRLGGATEAKKRERNEAAFALVLVVGALLGSMLDPQFGFNLRTVVLFVAVLVAMSAGAAVSAVMMLGYHRARKHPDLVFTFRALPLGLGIAAVCVLISRLSGFYPGYLYGVVFGVSFGRELAKHEEGHVVALNAWMTVVVAVGAWLLWAAINASASARDSFIGTVFLDDFLASLFVSGLVGTVISLFPLRFLPGHKLQSWHKGAWAATFLITLFVLVQVLLRPYPGPEGRSHAPLVTTIVLFIVFAGGSLAFRQHFVRKERRAAAAEAAHGPAGEAAIDLHEEPGTPSATVDPTPKASSGQL